MFIFKAILQTFPLGILPVDLLGFANISLDATNRIFRYGNDAPYDSFAIRILESCYSILTLRFSSFYRFFSCYMSQFHAEVPMISYIVDGVVDLF